jgi:ubiquinone/menaquinone biosynthesis C-methylase UbiE
MTSDARERYDRWHRDLGPSLEPDAPWHAMIRERLDIERDLAGRRVLEVGSGRGDFACWLARRDPAPQRVTAADLSPVAVAKGRAFAAELRLDGVDFAVADIQCLPFPDAAFDTVISCETIEHVPDPPRAVRELARVLRPGGRLFLSTSNYLNIWLLYRGYLRLFGRRFQEAGQPINRMTMTPATLRWVRRAGLRPESLDGRRHTLPFWPGRAALELRGLERCRLLRALAQQVLVVAVRPGRTALAQT